MNAEEELKKYCEKKQIHLMEKPDVYDEAQFSKEDMMSFAQHVLESQPKQLSDEEINMESNSRYPKGEGMYASYVAFVKGAQWARDRTGGGVDLLDFLKWRQPSSFKELRPYYEKDIHDYLTHRNQQEKG